MKCPFCGSESDKEITLCPGVFFQEYKTEDILAGKFPPNAANSTIELLEKIVWKKEGK